MPVNSKILFETISKEYEVGTLEQFQKKLKDPANRKALYEQIGKEFELGTFEQFEEHLGVEKKNGTGAKPSGGSSGHPSESTSTSKSSPTPYQGSIFDDYKNENDPVKAAILPLQSKKRELMQRHLGVDATATKPFVIDDFPKETITHGRNGTFDTHPKASTESTGQHPIVTNQPDQPKPKNQKTPIAHSGIDATGKKDSVHPLPIEHEMVTPELDVRQDVTTGKHHLTYRGEEEINQVNDQINGITSSAFPNAQVAGEYIKNKLAKNEVHLKPKEEPQDPNKLTLPGEEQPKKTQDPNDLDNFDLGEIGSHLDMSNLTDRLAFDSYQKQRNLDESLKGFGSLSDKLIKYKATQDKQLFGQIKSLTVSDSPANDLPNAYAGRLVAEGLMNPEVIKRAQRDPELMKQYQQATENLYSDFPMYAKQVVSEIISQERENRHMNNAFVNIPTQGVTDELVKTLLSEGKLHPRDKLIYEKYIRPYLGVSNSIGRGIGKLIPGVNAMINDSPISTPGFAENTIDAALDNIHGMASTVEDLASKLPATDFTSLLAHKNLQNETDPERLYQKLAHDNSIVSIDPKGFFHNLSQASGHMTGFVGTMILGGAAMKGLGAGELASELITNTLMFEGRNSEEAMSLYPEDKGKQLLHTVLSTGIDVALLKMIPTKNVRDGVTKTLRDDVRSVINDLSDKKITESAARKTLLDRFADVVKSNAKMGTTMMGFGVMHNTLDAALGGRDVKSEQVVSQALNDFKVGFLGSTHISIAAMGGKNPKLTGKVLREMAMDAPHFRQVIEDRSKLHPEKAGEKEELLRNLSDLELINNDLEHDDRLNEVQKEKFLLKAIQQKVLERKAEAAHDETFKKDYEKQASETKKQKESLIKGEDDAADHSSWDDVSKKPKDDKDVNPSMDELKKKFGYEEKINQAQTEAEKQQVDKDYADFIAAETKKAKDEEDKKPQEEVKKEPIKEKSQDESTKIMSERIPKEHGTKPVKYTRSGIESEKPANIAYGELKRQFSKLEKVLKECLT